MAGQPVLMAADPQIGASITNNASSQSVAIPTNSEFVRVATTVACSIRWGVGAQTAVATDMILTPNEAVIIKLNPGVAYTLASIGAAGTLTITKMVPG